jgi:hypothetical protein
LNNLQPKLLPVLFGGFVGAGGEFAQIASALIMDFLSHPPHIVNGRL